MENNSTPLPRARIWACASKRCAEELLARLELSLSTTTAKIWIPVHLLLPRGTLTLLLKMQNKQSCTLKIQACFTLDQASLMHMHMTIWHFLSGRETGVAGGGKKVGKRPSQKTKNTFRRANSANILKYGLWIDIEWRLVLLPSFQRRKLISLALEGWGFVQH